MFGELWGKEVSKIRLAYSYQYIRITQYISKGGLDTLTARQAKDSPSTQTLYMILELLFSYDWDFRDPYAEHLAQHEIRSLEVIRAKALNIQRTGLGRLGPCLWKK